MTSSPRLIAAVRNSARFIALASVAAFAFVSLPATASAANTTYVDYPPQGGIFKSAPYDYIGRAFPSIFPAPPIYLPQVTGSVMRKDPSNGLYGGPSCLGSPVLLCGVYTFRTVLDDFSEDWKASDNVTEVGSNTLVDGEYKIKVGQAGGFGQDTLYAENFFSVDSTLPDTSVISGPPQYVGNAAAPAHFEFGGNDPETNSYASGIDYFNCRIDGGAWDHCTPPGGSAPYTFDPTLPEGGHTLDVYAIDRANNEDPTPSTYSWIVDTTKPDISITTPAVRARYTLGQHVPSVFSCTDPLAGNPPAASGIKHCNAPSTVNTSHLGNFTFTVTAEDNAGNKNEKTVVYAVDPPKYNDLIDPLHPIAYYRLGDPVGATTMTDSSGNHNNGEYKNGISLRRPPAIACHVRPHAPYTCDLNADPQDWSATFPERDGYGFTNNIPAPQHAYTIEGWINRSDNNAGSIAGQGGAGQLFVNSEGKLALRQTQDTVTSNGPVLTPGQWWHVAATWDGHNTRLYVNGNQVGFSNSANKPPSGTSTLYVGYGDQAPWFHGSLDEVAYYGSALPGGAFATRYEVGTAHDVPSPTSPPAPASASLADLAIQRPTADIDSPHNGGLYAHGKMQALSFHCNDLDGDATVASCVATVDGSPTNPGGTPWANGNALPDTPGTHTVVVTAIDNTELTRSHTHTYTVKSFQDIYNSDAPLVYYRLGDGQNDPMRDSGPNHIDGIYKNAQESGGIGISGDGDRARNFFGSSGYGYANNITAPTFQSTLEVWVNPADQREESIVGHGDANEIYIGTDGVLHYRHMGVEVTAPALQVGVFSHVVGVWDGTSIFLYVNGQLKGQAEATKRPSSSSTFYVGYGEIRPWFKGALDEVAYYSKALTPNRILEQYWADPPPPTVTFGDTVTSPPPDNSVGNDSGNNDSGNNDSGNDNSNGNDASIAESGSGKVYKGAKNSAARKRSIAKCHKIKSAKKRAKCIKKAKKY